MKTKIYLTVAICALVIFTQSYLKIEAQTQPGNASAFVANAAVQATLEARQTIPVRGRMSLHFEVSPEQLKNGVVDVRRFNLAFFDVRQAAISGRETATKQGVLGMMIPPNAQNLRLRFDAQTQTASGEIPLQVHFSQLDDLFPPQLIRGTKEDDFAVSRTMRGRLKIQIKFTDALDRAADQAATARQTSRLRAQVSFDLRVEQLQEGGTNIPSFSMQVPDMQFFLSLGNLRQFEPGYELCIQPVRIRSGAADPAPTGAGLAFGLPGARTQWSKADVVLQVRSWMTVTNSDWKVVNSEAEEIAIRASVNVDDCIEIFFIENFDPVSLYGGGATWSSGTANAKIITSDGNVAGGIDLTHIAHELGHVLGMGHPGDPHGLYDASTNTLMCPSGWRRDNPTRNSQNNAAHVANPLLTFVMKVRTPGTDCTASADCGRCP